MYTVAEKEWVRSLLRQSTANKSVDDLKNVSVITTMVLTDIVTRQRTGIDSLYSGMEIRDRGIDDIKQELLRRKDSKQSIQDLKKKNDLLKQDRQKLFDMFNQLFSAFNELKKHNQDNAMNVSA